MVSDWWHAAIGLVGDSAVPCRAAEGGREAVSVTGPTVAERFEAVGAQQREVLWRRCPAGWPESRVWRISVGRRRDQLSPAQPRHEPQMDAAVVVNRHSHPRTQPIAPDRGGIPFPEGRRVGRGAPSWCRWVSRSPEEARAGRRAAPIWRWGSGRSCRGRPRGWCPRDGGAGPRRHCRKLQERLR